MIRTTVSILADRFKHPLLVGLFLIALLFLIGGVATQLAGRALVAGFLGIYAVLFAAMGLIGYGILFTGRFVMVLERQYGPAEA